MELRIDDLRGPEIAALLNEHLEEMRLVSPPESKHALDLTALRHPDITFWTLWEGKKLAGCAALKELSPAHGEVKSMRTAAYCRRRGVAATLVRRLVGEARRRGYRALSLETGSMPTLNLPGSSTRVLASTTVHRLPTTAKTQTAYS